MELYIQDKEREWHILGGAERCRQGIGKPFYLNLWENLDTIDLIQSERFEHWERKAGRIQYEFRTRILNKGRYLTSYHYNSSGYNQGPFNREFHKRQVIKEYSTSYDLGNTKGFEEVYYLKRISKGWVFRSFPGKWQAYIERPDGSCELLQEFDYKPTLRDASKLVREESFKRYAIFNDRWSQGFGGRL